MPDVVRILVKAGEPVGAALIDDWREIAGVNDRVQLAQARALLRDRIVTGFMRDGVTMIDPATTWVDVGVVLEPDCRGAAEHDAARAHVRRRRRAWSGRTARCATRLSGPARWCAMRPATGASIGPSATVGPVHLSAAGHPTRCAARRPADSSR